MTIFKEVRKHVVYYASLFAILSFGFFLASIDASDKRLQMAITVMTAFFYVSWGILHHLVNHDLTLKIVVEYILIGSLGITIVLFLLKGGLGI